jgi:hypothetical protein
VSESLPPVEGELAEALAALRREEPAPPEVRTRVRARLMNAVAVGLGAGTGALPRARGGVSGRSMLASVAFLAGGIVGAVTYAVLAPRAAPQVVYVDRVAPAPAAPPVPQAAPVPVSAPPATATGTVTATVRGPSPQSSQLSAERVLLDEARAAIAQGEPARALDRLARHRRTFPIPILGEEREAMVVEALAKAGRRDEAIARAAAFHKSWPDSLFASAVDDAVASVR